MVFRFSFLAWVVAMGCAQDAPPEPPVEPDPVPNRVPLDVPTLDASGTCVELLAGERLLSVSAEGDAWLVRNGPGAVLRVVQPDGSAREFEERFSTIAAGQAWSDDALTMIADGSLWRREGEFVDPIRWPEELPPPTMFCGDPLFDGDAFVIADGLYERAAGQWWQWSPMAGGFGTVQFLSDNGGACSGTAGVTLVGTDAGLWSVSLADTQPVSELTATTEAAFDDSFGTAALVDGAVHFGPSWEATTFEAGPATKLAAAAGVLFVEAGGRHYRYRDGAFSEVDLALEGSVELHPHAAGGLWADTGSALCHRSVEPLLRLRGVRPYERLAPEAFAIEVLEPTTSPVDARLDGVALDVSTGVVNVTAQAPGWHTLEFQAVGGPTRSVPFEVVSMDAGTWLEDIKPISDVHCAGSACHSADRDDMNRPGLSTYDDWVHGATAIRNRVGMTGDMPPRQTRMPTWSPELVSTIVDWIDGGMVEGDE
ncbi:MAG: hypothetical protein AAGF12_17290 [Myxococcota bacterium]